MKKMLFVLVALFALAIAGCSAEPTATPMVEVDQVAEAVAGAMVSVSDDATAALANYQIGRASCRERV